MVGILDGGRAGVFDRLMCLIHCTLCVSNHFLRLVLVQFVRIPRREKSCLGRIVAGGMPGVLGLISTAHRLNSHVSRSELRSLLY